MTHLSDHFAERVRASFERQHAMALIHACVMQQTICASRTVKNLHPDGCGQLEK